MISSSDNSNDSNEYNPSHSFSHNYFGKETYDIIDNLYSLISSLIAKACDHFEYELTHFMQKENKNITKEELKEIEEEIHNSVESLFNKYLNSLNYQFDVMENIINSKVLNMPQIPKEYQHDFCNIVNQDYLQFIKEQSTNNLNNNDTITNNLQSEEEELIKEILQIDENINNKYNDYLKEIYDRQIILQQRKQYLKEITYYLQHSSKLNIVNEELIKSSQFLEENIQKLIQFGNVLQEQYKLSKHHFTNLFPSNSDFEIIEQGKYEDTNKRQLGEQELIKNKNRMSQLKSNIDNPPYYNQLKKED
ncbi:hypothetical protein ABK040_000672 [Willaertia magna]